jgi:two-component system OmpR family sensor kinase
LSVRLAIIIAILLVLGLGAVGLSGTVLLRASLMSQIDAQLAAALTSTTRLDPRTIQAVPTDYVLLFFDSSGALIQSSPEAAAVAYGGPDLDTLTFADVDATEGLAFTVGSQDGPGHWRLRSVRAHYVFGQGTAALALSLDQVDLTVSRLRTILAAAAGAVAVAGTLTGFLLVRRSLRPLRGVESTAAAIAAGDLSQRVPDAEPGTEVGRLTDSLNGMLTQIEAAFEVRRASERRMRQFVSDASHELRTPLAAIRGYGELYRIGALGTKEEIDGALRRIEDEAARMGFLVADLLQLTRLDEGQPMRRDMVDLVPIAVDAAADLKALDPARPVTVVTLGTPGAEGLLGAVVWGDESRLRQVMANLIGNAVRHTPKGSPVEIAVGTAGTEPDRGAQADGGTAAVVRPGGADGVGVGADPGAIALIEVRDHGPGIAPAEATRVFERFYRLDSSRSRDSGGSGLGLAIVASVVAALGGLVEVRETPGGGATFRVAIPVAESGADGDAAARG